MKAETKTAKGRKFAPLLTNEQRSKLPKKERRAYDMMKKLFMRGVLIAPSYPTSNKLKSRPFNNSGNNQQVVYKTMRYKKRLQIMPDRVITHLDLVTNKK